METSVAANMRATPGVCVEAAEGGELGCVRTVELIQRLHAGELRAEELSAESRRECVEQLTLEGFGNGEIAALMRVSERTVRRDREAARRAGAVEPRLAMGDELMGEFQRLMLGSVQRLARMAQDDGSPAYARLWAEDAMTRIYQRYIDTAQRLGYIAHAGRRMEALRIAGRGTQPGVPGVSSALALARRVLGQEQGRGVD